MARSKMKSSGNGTIRSKTGVCTMCSRAHPKGKKQRNKARAAGWKSCRAVAIDRNKSR